MKFISKFAFKASLNQFWSLINSQQLSLNMPLCAKLKFPANAAYFNQQMIQIAFFDVVPTEYLEQHLWYMPE